jgi:MFS family permease
VRRYNKSVVGIQRFLVNRDVPEKYRNNFLHLFLDIAWFGVLSGSAINFLNIYVTRLGATPLQIGLLSATTAVVNLLFAIPAAHWLEKRSIGKAVFWTSIFYRIGFLLWVPLPWLFDASTQTWALIGLALLMGIPLTALGVGFNVIFATAVPVQYRAYVAGTRNVLLSIAFMLTSLGCGILLDRVAYPLNYQIVFLIGALGGGMSSFHLYHVRPFKEDSAKEVLPSPQPESTVLPKKHSNSWFSSLRTDIWKTPFKITLLLFLGFHLAQYLAVPLFPVYNVRNLQLTDQNIGTGTALFYLTVLLASTQLARIVKRAGHKNVTGWGVAGLSIYPIALAFSTVVWQYYLVSAVGGLIWALIAGASANYLLEKIPVHDRPSHLAWYTVILNLAVLTGSLTGPIFADFIGIVSALVLAGFLRLIAGMAILKWG